VQKAIRNVAGRVRGVAEEPAPYDVGNVTVMRGRDEVIREIKDLESEMKRAAKDLDYERAAELRDKIMALRRSIA